MRHLTKQPLITVMPALLVVLLFVPEFRRSGPMVAGPLVAAQASPSATRADDLDARTYLPEAQELGEGWVMTGTPALSAEPTVFRGAAAAAYGGPNGSRVLISAYLVTQGRVAVRQSWEEATTVFESQRYEFMTYNYGREESLAGLPLPAGCVEAKRTDGVDPYFGLTAAQTMCAADPDVIVLVVVSGSVGDLNGYQAADRVVELALAS